MYHTLIHVHSNTHFDLFSTGLDIMALCVISAVLNIIILDHHDNKQALLIVSIHSLLANWQTDVEKSLGARKLGNDKLCCSDL